MNVYANCVFILLLYRLQCLLLMLIKLEKISFCHSPFRHSWAKRLLCRGSSSLGSSFACQMSRRRKRRGLTWTDLDTDAIWPAGHAKQGGRTFIRGSDPRASDSTQQHALGGASAALRRLMMHVKMCTKIWNMTHVSIWVSLYFVFLREANWI